MNLIMCTDKVYFEKHIYFHYEKFKIPNMANFFATKVISKNIDQNKLIGLGPM